MRAAWPTCMPTTTPGSELLSSWLQEHPALDSVDVPSVRGPRWRQSSAPPHLLSKIDGRRSYGNGGLLGPQACYPATESHPRGGQEALCRGDNVGTALAIPIATEGLELDLQGWLALQGAGDCDGEQTVRTGTLSAWGDLTEKGHLTVQGLIQTCVERNSQW